MFMIACRSLVLASVLAVSAAVASATTVSLHYEGGTASGTVKFKSTPLSDAIDGTGAGAYGFNMKDVTPSGSILGDFVAWCLDIEHHLGTKGNHAYEITSTPFTNSYGLDAAQKARVQSVFDANYAFVDLASNTQAAGFQVALWNALYDTDASAGTGDFSIYGGKQAWLDIVTAADAYLAAAQGFAGKRVWNLTFLQSNGDPVRQNLVTVAPVPVPAAAGMLLLALGGLAAAGRRRRSI
jgi:hypothetical protein